MYTQIAPNLIISNQISSHLDMLRPWSYRASKKRCFFSKLRLSDPNFEKKKVKKAKPGLDPK